MTTRKALYLATITDGVVEFDREASDEDVESFGWVRRPLAGRQVGTTESGEPVFRTVEGMGNGVNGNGHTEGPVVTSAKTYDEVVSLIGSHERKKPSERIDEIKVERLERNGVLPDDDGLAAGGNFVPTLGDVIAFLDEEAQR
jgi:hypothetical protein